MRTKFEYGNIMEIPRIEKIVLNMGVGEATADRKKVEVAAAQIGQDRRPEAADDQGQEVDRHLQGA